MQVIATAGHSEHGKSTLVQALTGMDPARWEANRGRGLTVDLGHAWLTLPSGEQLAFIDVPGHERFVPNMLAGVGPVPAVLFVVAADEAGSRSRRSTSRRSMRWGSAGACWPSPGSISPIPAPPCPRQAG